MRRILLLNHIENAYDALRGNKVRTFLTTLGISLGVACMTAILSLTYGANQIISQQVDSIGGNIAVIRPGNHQSVKNLVDLTTKNNSSSFTTSSLTEEDYQMIADLPGVESAAPLMAISGTIRSQTEDVKHSTIIATTPSFEHLADITIPDGEGQFIDTVTNNDTVVIGQQLSIDLYGTTQSIGKTLTIKGQQFTVIGILEKTEAVLNYNQIDFNNTAFISLESGKVFNQGVAQLRQINLQTKTKTSLEQVTKEASKILTDNHSGDHDFTILTGEQISQPTSQLFLAIASVTTIVAAISLLIGGIGIMNIMLVSVAERTREIGIRKAVGASGWHITMQFLIESLVMSLVGGVFGYLFGYALAFTISSYLPFLPAFSWQIAAVSLGISLVVGVLFGVYPAIRAARKNPIESLRQYHWFLYKIIV